ncbi:MAG: O-Antigen ligase [Lacunisphaera sp.]|nr:O-Antigen ligase [Lacunisphaera sp.]
MSEHSGQTPGWQQPTMARSQPSADLLAKFRSDRRRLPLHPLEKAVLAAVTVHLCFLPWALGTMHVWSQLTSLALSAMGMLLALIPRTYSGDNLPQMTADRGRNPAPNNPQPITNNRGGSFRLTMWPRLLHFPIFWLGLALLAYIAVQGFNPSWVWERNATTWWLRRVNDIPWLPTSVDTPFARFDVWRQFIIYASAWLVVCTVWTGFTRRRSLQILLTGLVINAVVLASVGFFQKFAALDSYLFLMKWPVGATAFASFIYRNHAGAYFALITLLALALAIWTHGEGERAGRKSTPAGAFVIAALLLTTAVFFTLSRGASIILTCTWAILVPWLWLYRRRLPASQTANPIVALAVVGLFAAVIGGTIRYLDFSSVEQRFHSLFTNYRSPNESVRSRVLAHASARAMLADHWQRGVGAGGFRYLFPEYIKDKPEIYAGGHYFWEHAHCDWLEIPTDLGAAGTILVLAAGIYWIGFFWRRRAVWHGLAAPVLLACIQPLLHGLFDFPFQCPALLATWCALIAIAARWLELDETR